MGPPVPRDCKVLKCNVNLLWVVIGIAFVIKMSIGQTWVIAQIICDICCDGQAMCFEPKPRLLVVVRCISFV
jgi:hypothetical protein